MLKQIKPAAKKTALTAEQLALAKHFAEALSEPDAPTPGDIASACGISEQAVSNWKRTGKITKKNLQIVSELTGWSVQRLMTGQNEQTLNSDTRRPRVFISYNIGAAEIFERIAGMLNGVDEPVRRAAAALLSGIATQPENAAALGKRFSNMLLDEPLTSASSPDAPTVGQPRTKEQYLERQERLAGAKQIDAPPNAAPAGAPRTRRVDKDDEP